VNSSVFD